jgi:uncharacterized protein
MNSRVTEQEVPSHWQPLDLAAFIAFFVATVFVLPPAAFLLLRIFQPGLQVQDLSGIQQISIQAVMDLALVGFIVFVVKIIHGKPILSSLHVIPRRNRSVGWLIAASTLLALTASAVSLFFPTPADSPLEKLLTTTSSVVAFAVFGIVFAPLLEEIIFRGFVFTVLADLEGPKVAVPVTALLFTAPHVVQLWGSWAPVVVIFVVGYVFTWIRHRTDSVIPSIIMHTAYNAMIFGVAALGALLGPREP